MNSLRARVARWWPPVDGGLRLRVANDAAETNRRRFAWLMPILAVGHAIHVAVFRLSEAERAGLPPLVVQWRDGIVLIHAITVPLALGMAVTAFASRAEKPVRSLGVAAALVYVLHGAAIAGVDQYTVTSVTPYIGYCLGAAVIIALSPLGSMLVYITGAIAFTLAVTAVQKTTTTRLAVLPSGMSMSVLGLLLSLLIGAARRRDFIQRETIDRQRGELSALNAGLEGRVKELAQATEWLRVERAKSDALLRNVLPEPIAARLKETEGAIAESFREVTVLFADVEGFTPMASRLAPEEVVGMLNQVFTEFDRLAEKHGLEKIKTIGDAYMVAGGLPEPRSDHALAVAEMALDMMQSLPRLRTPNGDPLNLRIGIHTGPVVAGVIGTRKFSYDLWGDTVNTASRMESHGASGRVHVTAAVRDALGGRYAFEDRGRIALKGKGELTTFFLTGRVGEHSAEDKRVARLSASDVAVG